MMDFSHQKFPNSLQDPFKITSPQTNEYNCIAWSLEHNDLWFWPGPHQYWPDDIPREETLEAFIKLYQKYGYVKCNDGSFERRYIKIAIFALNGVPQHAARQLNESLWTSKLGKAIDVSHSIQAMEGGDYGNVVQYMKKRISRFQQIVASLKNSPR